MLMMRLSVLLLCCTVAPQSSAQNLAPNPGFETTGDCVDTAWSDAATYADGYYASRFAATYVGTTDELGGYPSSLRNASHPSGKIIPHE